MIGLNKFVLGGLAAAATLAAFSSAALAEDVYNIDDGPGRGMVIVRGGGEDWSDQRQVLAYQESNGSWVRVYADHPVTRAQVEDTLASAQRDSDQARVEAREAIAEGRLAAAEGRREAQAARMEGERARVEGREAADEGRREADQARREADQERREARREAQDARREADQARAEAMADLD